MYLGFWQQVCSKDLYKRHLLFEYNLCLYLNFAYKYIEYAAFAFFLYVAD